MTLKEAYNKIDNFCCSNHNSLQGNTIKYLNGREEKINMFADYQETKNDDFCKDANEMVDCLDTIQEALEVLEIIKANKNIIFSKNPKYENMNADDFFKLSRWLEE